MSTPISPECRDRFKHAACAGLALDEATDEIVDCACPCHGKSEGRLTAYHILGILRDDGRTTQQIIDEERK